jgi:hypothetical protein
MRGGESSSTVLSALTSSAPRCSVSYRRHAPIQPKSRVEIKPRNGSQGRTVWSAVLDFAHKYGSQWFVKTTLEIPGPLFRRAKATAARQGRTLKQLVQEALSEKIARIDGSSRRRKPWMVLAGGLKHLHSENRRIERVIDAEFENIEPEDRQ